MKTIDQMYQCQVPGQVFGLWQLQCHLRIFQPHSEVQTVIVTDVGFERGWFIPYLVEKLVDQIVQEFQLDPARLIWIEHYTSNFRKPTCADFSQVTFEWQDGQAANPQWIPLEYATVEALTGGPLKLALV